jgi:hypothetical protein
VAEDNHVKNLEDFFQRQTTKMTNELDTLRQQLADAQAACAEKNHAINELLQNTCDSPSTKSLDVAKRALSAACGTGWQSPEVVQRLTEGGEAVKPYDDPLEWKPTSNVFGESTIWRKP